MKKLKRFLALLLALTMVASMAACGGNNAGKETSPQGGDTSTPADDTTAAPADDTTAPAGEDLSWLNLGGTYPIVAEGVEKTLSVCLAIADEEMDSYQDKFQYRFTVEQMNINLDVQAVPESAWAEKLPLILADVENLPDIILNANFTVAELYRYGDEEGLLLDVAPYITEEYMPCLTQFFAEFPEYKDVWLDPNGHIYSINFLRNGSEADAMHWFHINYKWMEDCGLDPVEDLPETLDEFTDLMRKFKEVKSAELGEEIYPIAGGYTGWNSIYHYLLVALGYVGYHSDDAFPGGTICMRDGEVVLPCADRGAWEGFVKTMKTWYDEGLVHPEYFTGEASALDALISACKVGYVTAPPQVWVGGDNFLEWWGAPLLTSEWSDEPGVPSYQSVNGVGKHVITTACEEIELALAFFDFFYNMADDPSESNYYFMTNGPYEGTPEAELYPEYTFCKKDETGAWKITFDSNEYVDANDVLKKEIGLWGNVSLGLCMTFEEDGSIAPEYSDAQWEILTKVKGTEAESWNMMTVEDRQTVSTYGCMYAFIEPYVVEPKEQMPALIKLDPATQETANDLYVALKEFAVQETAKFITGQRDISELNDYFDEIEALGATEYVQIYADYYASVNG